MTFCSNGEKLIAYRSRYSNNNAPYICLYTENGEPWIDVTINLDICDEKMIGINHDFLNSGDKELINSVINKFFNKKVCSFPSGFVVFDVYQINEDAFNEIPELE